MLADGCEADTGSSPTDCGGCGLACPAVNVEPTCVAGVCAGECDPGFADCNDDLLTDGCETDTQSSESHCGGCGSACSPNHVVPYRMAGICDGSCAFGFADCSSRST